MAAHQVIARKYRPRTFDEVVGQDAIARTLKNAIQSDRVAHAYMFCGPRGVGKTSTARILARALNCLERPGPAIDPCGVCDLCVRATAGEDLDVLEIDAASNRKVDDARNLIANVSFHPTRARFKVYVVDEVHMLTTEAFNALLKTLEEPPAHVKFIFATTDPQKVPATILSRCQRFDFRPVPAGRIAEALQRVCDSEGLTAEPGALIAVARASVGGMRDAQSLLEQLGTLGAGKVTLEDLHSLLGTVPAVRMRHLFDAVSGGDVAATLERVGEILDAGTDPGELLRQCMRHARDLMVLRAQGPRGADVAADEETRAALAEQAGRFSDATLVYSVTLLSEALKNVRLLGEGRLFAETALARLAGHGELRFLDQIARDLSRLEQRLDGGEGGSPARRPRGDGPAPAGAPPRSPPPARPESNVRETPAPPVPRDDRPEPPAAVAEQPPTAASGPVDLTGRWGEVLELVRASSRLRTALAPALVHACDATTLTLSLPRGNDFLRSALRDPRLATLLGEAIASVAGRALRIRTVEREAEPEPAAEAGNGAPAPDLHKQRLSSAEIEAIRQAPITKLIETELAGRIVHMERDSQ